MTENALHRLNKGELLGRSLLLDDEQVQVRAETTSKRQPPRTWEELRGFAEQRGVTQLYDKALDGFRPLFDSVNRTRSNVAFVGAMGPDRSRNTILGIYPEASSEQAGLAVLIFTDRACEYFGLSDSAVKEVIGQPSGHAKTWDPQHTFFFDETRLVALVRLLKRAKEERGFNN